MVIKAHGQRIFLLLCAHGCSTMSQHRMAHKRCSQELYCLLQAAWRQVWVLVSTCTIRIVFRLWPRGIARAPLSSASHSSLPLQVLYIVNISDSRHIHSTSNLLASQLSDTRCEGSFKEGWIYYFFMRTVLRVTIQEIMTRGTIFWYWYCLICNLKFI